MTAPTRPCGRREHDAQEPCIRPSAHYGSCCPHRGCNIHPDARLAPPAADAPAPYALLDTAARRVTLGPGETSNRVSVNDTKPADAPACTCASSRRECPEHPLREEADEAAGAGHNAKTCPRCQDYIASRAEPAPAALGEVLTLVGELRQAINRHSAENGSDTPDFILAEFLQDCLIALDAAIRKREKWYGRDRLAAARQGEEGK